jgi:hypothetical protein
MPTLTWWKPPDEAAKTAIVGAIVAMDILYILGEARNAR